VTQSELSKQLNKSVRTIERNMKTLQEAKIIARIGSNTTGYWEVLQIDDCGLHQLINSVAGRIIIISSMLMAEKMGRKPSDEFQGAIYHVIKWGKNRRSLEFIKSKLSETA